MSLKEKLIQQAEEYCRANGISRARLATIVANDGKFFKRIEEQNGGFTVKMYERFQKFFDENGQEETAA